MTLNLNTLQLIEIQLSEQATKSRLILRPIRELTHAFCPSSCRRQVMIFFHINKPERFEHHFQYLQSVAEKCVHLQGKEAYAFLLSWISGGEHRVTKSNSRLPLYNDNHILGKFREAWTVFERTQCKNDSEDDGDDAQEVSVQDHDERRDYRRIMNAVLQDAHEIRKKIEAKCYGVDLELRATLDKVITNVVYSRSHNLPVIYDAMAEANDRYSLILRESSQMEISRLRSKMGQLPEESAARIGLFSKLRSLEEHASALDDGSIEKTCRL